MTWFAAKSRLLIFLFLASLFSTCDKSEFASPPFHYISLGQADYIENARATSDGGYLLVGSTTSIRNNEDLLAIKLDKAYNLQWAKTFGGPKEDVGFDAIETSDHQFLLTGRLRSDRGDYDLVVVKISRFGEQIWARIVGGTGSDEGRRLHNVSNNRYLVIGTSSSYGALSADIFTLLLDQNGDSLASAIMGWAGGEAILNSIETADGNYLLTGYTGSFGSFNRTLVAKVDLSGNILWSRTYGGCNRMEGHAVAELPDGNFIVAGRNGIRCHPYVDYDASFMRLGSSGDSLWLRNIGVTTYDEFSAISRLKDGTLLGAGQSYYISPKYVDDWQALLVRMTADGDTLWTRSFGGPEADGIRAVCERPDGGLLLVGYTQNHQEGVTSIMLLEADEGGNF